MSEHEQVSRRNFVGGVAAALGYMALKPESLLYAQARTNAPGAGAAATGAVQQAAPTLAEQMATYDGLAKLANNENPYGAPPSVMKAMNDVWKYSNRYGYPDPDIIGTIARHHGVKNENVMIAAGSGEILDIVGSTFLDGDNNLKVVAPETTYNTVFTHAVAVRASALAVPLTADHQQNVDEMLRVTKKHYREVGFVYLCNPNNPTGRIVPKADVKRLVEGLPDDMPILIDEAYHHFIEDSNYATSVPYVLEGRPVIIARTFSKIVALAGMRLGYAIAPAEIIAKMKPYGTGTVNALVKYGAVAALTNPEAIKAQENTRKANGELRRKTVASLKKLGYDTIPSEANFFMVSIKRPVQPVIEEFKKKGVLVGRPFPPMTEHLRVSVGTPDEMDRFVKAFGEIFAGPAPSAAPSGGRGGPGGR